MDKLSEIHGKTLSFNADSVSIDPEKISNLKIYQIKTH